MKAPIFLIIPILNPHMIPIKSPLAAIDSSQVDDYSSQFASEASWHVFRIQWLCFAGSDRNGEKTGR